MKNQLIKKIRYLNQLNRWAEHKLLEITLEDNAEFQDQPLILTFFHNYFPEYQSILIQDSLTKFLASLFGCLFKIIGDPNEHSFIKKIQSQSNMFYLLIAYDEPEVAESILKLALDLLGNTQEKKLCVYKKRLNMIKNRYEDIRMGPSTRHIAQAAIRKNIPVKRIGNGSLLQLGQGHKQRRIQASLIDSTSAVADSIVQDKFLTKKMLHSMGIPTPKGCVVCHEISATYDADTIGYPVVVKPIDGNQGNGVCVNIHTEQELTAAFRSAKKYSADVLIEQYITGDDYRLLVVGNQLVAAAKRVPPIVIGDGIQTISQLIDQMNQDVLRLDEHNGYLSKVKVDEIVIATLKQQGFCLHDIPNNNQQVFLRLNSNLSTGGHAIDVTDLVHPSITRQAIQAATFLGIDVCGIDLVCKDITQPLINGNGCFIELNLAPGIRMHIAPSFGSARDVGSKVIEHMFKGESARIPVIAITGTNGKTTCTRILSQILQDYNFKVGMTCTTGIYINQERVYAGDCAGPWSAESILSHPEVEACVLETARGGILRNGLGFDRADVVIITNIGQADHLGLDYLETPNDIAELKLTLLKALSSTGYAVLNADDKLLLNATKDINANIIYFSIVNNNPVLKAHLDKGQPIIYFDNQTSNIYLKTPDECRIFNIKDISYILHQNAMFQIQNMLCVIAGIWALKLPIQHLSHHLSNLKINRSDGRFNIFHDKERTIVVDYAHNIDALHAVINTIRDIPASKRLVLTSSAGDRQDHIILQQMKLLADNFDHGIIYQDLCQRGRKDGEVLSLIRQGFDQGNRLSNMHDINDEASAIDHILGITEPGELCLLLVDDVDNSLRKIKHTLQVTD